MKDAYIDLHVHSNYSDGKRSIQYISNKIEENNIGAIALTEHYNMSSYRALKSIVDKSVIVIPAIELSASLLSFGLSKAHVCHIVAYYPSTKIYNILDEYELSRDKCVKKTIQLLQKNGIDICYNKVCQTARNKNSIGRFDIAISLAKLGYSSSPVKAYREYLDLNSPIYIEREKLEVKELIQKLLQCGGLPVLVHPKSLKLNETDFAFFAKELKDAGLIGIEAYNPHNTEEQRQRFLSICQDLEIIATIGSDYHGRSQDNIEIGYGVNENLKISDFTVIEQLQQKKYDLFLQNS